MPARASLVTAPKVVPILGVALLFCYVAASRVRYSSARRANKRRGRGIAAAEHQRSRRPIHAQVCEGLVDLIKESEAPGVEEATGPSMTRKELAEGLLVIVVIGPTSTRFYQSYVVDKLLRYLRWSNLLRKHFSMDDQDPSEAISTAISPIGETNGSTSRNEHRRNGDIERSNGSSGGGSGASKSEEGDGLHHTSGRAPKPLRYTYSDRGKAAALETIAVQDSAKMVASWLNGLSHGGVAIVEARASWASTHRGRDTLNRFLRQTAEPDLGILWVELLPSGLAHPRGGLMASGPARLASAAAADRRSWKSANGLARVPQRPGEHVVDTFLQTGSLVGAGGHVIYESVRGGARGAGTAAISGVGAKGKVCFVSLADEGINVRTQLRDPSCPLVGRVGAFAAALRRKKSWHGCPVYMTRHGESLMNQTKSMGGDDKLSETGDRYAGVLADFVSAQADAPQSRLSVWCSPMKRAVQTARAIKCHRYIQWHALRELDTGVFNGFSYKQVEREYPDEFYSREKDKLNYRYPEGESYLDVVNRLHPVVVAIEKMDDPVIVISHQAILRCLYAYFQDVSLRFMPRLPIPLHTVVKLTPADDLEEGTSRWKELRFALMKPTPLEQLADGVATMGLSNRKASHIGESLS